MSVNPNRDRDREAEALAAPLHPDSLVGSCFHSGHQLQWQGCVVAEPQPGIYLVELHEWFVGQSSCQQLVRIEDMSDWMFYDDTEWMDAAYQNGVKQRWERAENEAAA